MEETLQPFAAMMTASREAYELALEDDQAVVNNTSGLRRLMLAANARMTTPVNIPGIVLPVRPAELATEINCQVSRLTADRRDA